jgi:hypothetical protein
VNFVHDRNDFCGLCTVDIGLVRRHRQRGQNANDGGDNHQLDQGKATLYPGFERVSIHISLLSDDLLRRRMQACVHMVNQLTAPATAPDAAGPPHKALGACFIFSELSFRKAAGCEGVESPRNSRTAEKPRLRSPNDCC